MAFTQSCRPSSGRSVPKLCQKLGWLGWERGRSVSQRSRRQSHESFGGEVPKPVHKAPDYASHLVVEAAAAFILGMPCQRLKHCARLGLWREVPPCGPCGKEEYKRSAPESCVPGITVTTTATATTTTTATTAAQQMATTMTANYCYAVLPLRDRSVKNP